MIANKDHNRTIHNLSHNVIHGSSQNGSPSNRPRIIRLLQLRFLLRLQKYRLHATRASKSLNKSELAHSVYSEVWMGDPCSARTVTQCINAIASSLFTELLTSDQTRKPHLSHSRALLCIFTLLRHIVALGPSARVAPSPAKRSLLEIGYLYNPKFISCFTMHAWFAPIYWCDRTCMRCIRFSAFFSTG